HAAKIKDTLSDFYQQVLDLEYTGQSAASFIHPTPFKNLYILPATHELENLLHPLTTRNKLYKLRHLLDSLDPFDNIFMDTPPALNFYTQSALIAGDSCLIPFDCDLFSRNAIYNLIRGVTEIRAKYHANLRVEGVIVNQFQPSASLPQKLVDELKVEGLPILSTYITQSVKIRESHDLAMPMIHYEPKHKLTSEFVRIFQSLQTNSIVQPDALPKKRTRKPKKSKLVAPETA
ncbi:MAG TPA: ParA family protein, partial [Gammaproteobacteria bacterium]|nr:ParA family protein [Gammaproteobacteria bacterium]